MMRRVEAIITTVVGTPEPGTTAGTLVAGILVAGTLVRRPAQ
ncbi:MAG: PEP-CTERM sorting domain-containing protein [Pseudonocardiales bacterium]|nr:PEP-CTERM sorting domain-containing protein [Pseudonocardiales bacterium]